jgi:hypothetical protein
MCCLPERGSDAKRLDPVVAPPSFFLAMPMQFAVMESANGDGKLVAHLPSDRSLLGELDVMGVRRRATADQTRLRGHEFEMLAIALTEWLAEDGFAAAAGRLLVLRFRSRDRLIK